MVIQKRKECLFEVTANKRATNITTKKTTSKEKATNSKDLIMIKLEDVFWKKKAAIRDHVDEICKMRKMLIII